ncbi:hypothetical protein EDI_252520 [Entamoeba dispar SAW760]|uniref:Uncharacterized protein n=1 Tax=Entamoeba dispar (strain ATCC PRA-260 / SAW760) TaxID=370354 RepID=B0EF57_ENTDS|nr:uncharacterized protein EDI_252520 [Entamoeba dispar SAW760]EDR26787.1 hypothetical protein EDI_252520 [Entamoeba dispar SAW760]|eukprot:EDR26787.1 hypothetical protein EDI_252520 [Entamoeba dispar SAW760]
MDHWGILKCMTPGHKDIPLQKWIEPIGRANKECNIHEPNISSKHCIIEKRMIGNEAIFFITDVSSNGTWVNHNRIDKLEQVPLTCYDEITLLDPNLQKKKCISYMFVDMEFEKKESTLGGPQNRYEILDFLGVGGFGVVRKVKRISDGTLWAMKKINISKARAKGEDKMIRNECEVLRQVNHPSIIKLGEVLETRDYVYIIMEFINGGNLLRGVRLANEHEREIHKQEFDILKEKMADCVNKNKVDEYNALEEKYLNLKEEVDSTAFSEDVCRLITKQILEALKYLHSKNIIHRDLKLENIMWTGKNYEIRVTDFGLGRVVGDDFIAGTICGTTLYAPPEFYKRQPYNGPKADIYSCGIVLYNMICNNFPFDRSLNPSELARAISEGKIIKRKKLESSSIELIDLLNNMLCVDPEKRFTSEQCLNHEFFERKHEASSPLIELSKPAF